MKKIFLGISRIKKRSVLLSCTFCLTLGIFMFINSYTANATQGDGSEYPEKEIKTTAEVNTPIDTSLNSGIVSVISNTIEISQISPETYFKGNEQNATYMNQKVLNSNKRALETPSIEDGYVDVGNEVCFYYNGEKVVYDSSNVTELQKDFIELIGSAALSKWEDYGLLPSITIAQAICESRWGESELSRYYNNFFGIKWTSSCRYGSVFMDTKEEVDGRYVTCVSKFRSYPSAEAGIEDRFLFLTENPRYSNIIGVTDYRTEALLLQENGYATSSSYAETLINIIEKYELYIYDENIQP